MNAATFTRARGAENDVYGTALVNFFFSTVAVGRRLVDRVVVLRVQQVPFLFYYFLNQTAKGHGGGVNARYKTI